MVQCTKDRAVAAMTTSSCKNLNKNERNKEKGRGYEGLSGMVVTENIPYNIRSRTLSESDTSHIHVYE